MQCVLVFRIQRERFMANAGYLGRGPRGHKTLAARDPVYDCMSLLHPVTAVSSDSFVDICHMGTKT